MQALAEFEDEVIAQMCHPAITDNMYISDLMRGAFIAGVIAVAKAVGEELTEGGGDILGMVEEAVSLSEATVARFHNQTRSDA